MENKKQIIFIRGGETFENKDDFYEYLQNSEINLINTWKSWRDWLATELEDSFDFIVPSMPCTQDSDYKAWKIWFEKYLALVSGDEIILVGNSLGGTFLLKYLTENKINKKIIQLNLVASCVFDNFDEGATKERLNTFNFDIESIGQLDSLCDDIHIYHSEDDSCVSFKNFEFIKEKLPNATPHAFTDRDHFFQSTFPEILDVINKLK